MLKPLKRAGGRRHYRPDDVVMLTTIHRLLNNEGYTIKGACKHLNDTKHGSEKQDSFTASAASVINGTTLAALQTIRNRLSAALAAA